MKRQLIFIFLLHLMICGCKTNGNDLPILGPEHHKVPHFSFINQNGDTTGSIHLDGKIFVVDFIFTHCKGICPRMTSELKRVQDAFSSSENLKLISFTVDPERDHPEVLSDYMDQFGANPDKWTMYTGDKKELYHLARKGFFITAVDGNGGAEDFIHSEKLVLVDDAKRIRGYYDGTDSASVNNLISDIRKLLK